MVARTEAALRSWRAAGVQLVAAVEKGREAAGFCRGKEKGGCWAAAVWGRNRSPCCWLLLAAVSWWSRRQQLVVVVTQKAAASWGKENEAQGEKRGRRRRMRKESDG